MAGVGLGGIGEFALIDPLPDNQPIRAGGFTLQDDNNEYRAGRVIVTCPAHANGMVAGSKVGWKKEFQLGDSELDGKPIAVVRYEHLISLAD